MTPNFKPSYVCLFWTNYALLKNPLIDRKKIILSHQNQIINTSNLSKLLQSQSLSYQSKVWRHFTSVFTVSFEHVFPKRVVEIFKTHLKYQAIANSLKLARVFKGIKINHLVLAQNFPKNLHFFTLDMHAHGSLSECRKCQILGKFAYVPDGR